MAITVNIYYTGEKGCAKKFAEEMTAKGVVAQIRSKAGNLRYDYFLPMGSEDTVLLIDSWEDQEALDDHHHSPVMQTILALREKYDLHMKVERYITDAAGIPAKDQAFIKE